MKVIIFWMISSLFLHNFWRYAMNDKGFADFMNTAVGGAGKKAESKRAPAPVVSAVESPKESAGGGEPPHKTPDSPDGGDGSGKGDGMKGWMNGSKGGRVLRFLLISVLVMVPLLWINDWYLHRNLQVMQETSKLDDAKNARDIALMNAQAASAATLAASQHPSAPLTHERFVSARKQMMVDRCGRNVQELSYKVEPGCFYFDNVDGGASKSLTIKSATSVRSIESEFDDKPGITLVSSDGSTCVSTAADHCTSWVREHSAMKTGGFHEFRLQVPPGQGVIANINVN